MPNYNYDSTYFGYSNSGADNIAIGCNAGFATDYKLERELDEAEQAELAEDKRKYPLFFWKELAKKNG